MSGEETREELQRVLREARAGGAGGQADLDDPHRAEVLEQMMELQERARTLGLDHVVTSAQLAIDEMRAAEDALRVSLEKADEAHDAGLKNLLQDRDDQGWPRQVVTPRRRARCRDTDPAGSRRGGSRVIAVSRSHVDEPAAEVAGKGPDDLVFTAPRGGLLLLRNRRANVFEHAIEQAELDALTPRVRRHTAASLATPAGASVRHVQAPPGHASPVLTLSTYQHLVDDDLDAVADRLDAVAEAARIARADQVRTAATVVSLA